jgi:hypothetical protein
MMDGRGRVREDAPSSEWVRSWEVRAREGEGEGWRWWWWWRRKVGEAGEWEVEPVAVGEEVYTEYGVYCIDTVLVV